MIAVLRRHLRKDGWTLLRLSQELGVGEATVKRWLAGKGLTVDRLERIARLCGLVLGDLAREAEQAAGDLAQELTLAQEKALSTNIFLSFLFMALLGGIAPDEIAADFHVPGAAMEAALDRLERLALIDRLKSGRVRPLVDRALVFRKQPLRALFEAHMKHTFFELDYADPDTIYTADTIKLSAAGAAQLAELIERHHLEVQQMADRDLLQHAGSRAWYGTLSVMRQLDLGPLRADGVRAWSEAIGAEGAKGPVR
ncbi:MAG: helix-turn-helix transcriptional regulator [Sphingomonadales bacterium]|nr:helix-turn-helix transcriptional regulator [Sphingomonadales bacterium]